MKIKVRETILQEHDVPFDYPFFRKLRYSVNSATYYKFEGPEKVVMVGNSFNEASIVVRDHRDKDLIEEMLCSEMAYGLDDYSIIDESEYDKALQELIDLVHRS